jgi:hypothetical protein
VKKNGRALTEKSVLGVAGEFAVTSELCRRNIYAQLTLGNQKRIDLLTMSREGKFLKFSRIIALPKYSVSDTSL